MRLSHTGDGTDDVATRSPLTDWPPDELPASLSVVCGRGHVGRSFQAAAARIENLEL